MIENSNKLTKKLIGLKIQGRGIARKGYPILENGKPIGELTSGSWSPTLNEGIALAYLPKEIATIGTQVSVKIRDKNQPATIVKRPFYRRVS